MQIAQSISIFLCLTFIPLHLIAAEIVVAEPKNALFILQVIFISDR